MKKSSGFLGGLFGNKNEDELLERVTKLETELVIVMSGVEQLASALEELAKHVKDQRELLNELVEEHNAVVNALKEKSSAMSALDRKSSSKPN